MQPAGPRAFGPPDDRASAVGVLRAAVAAGVDHIDTAQYYGPGVVNDLIREALHLADRGSAPVLEKCVERGVAFVPFSPLGRPRGRANPVLAALTRSKGRSE